MVCAQDQPDAGSCGGSARRRGAVRRAVQNCRSTARQIAEGNVEPMGDGQALAYAGVDGQYFSAVLIPSQSARRRVVRYDRSDRRRPKPDARTPPTLRERHVPRDAEADRACSWATRTRDSYQVFIGPKRPDLLAQYHAGQRSELLARGHRCTTAGRSSAPWPGRCSAILHFFYGIVGNYGIAIIMLTVLVRGAMFPISYKQTQNMARMQALKPEMDRINEKYKTDMQKRSQATQELYRKHKINPLGGCLPVFLQLPIFIGLYRALMVDVELRQSPLFGQAIRWCSNLAAPDMLWNWSAIMPDFINQRPGIVWPGPVLERSAAGHGRPVPGDAEDGDAGADERAGRDAAEDDEVHDDLHGPDVLQSGQRACACTSSPRACGASPSGSCCRRPAPGETVRPADVCGAVRRRPAAELERQPAVRRIAARRSGRSSRGSRSESRADGMLSIAARASSD